MPFTPKNVMSVRDIPVPHKDDMRRILDKILTEPHTNPFHRSTLNASYYVPRLQKAVDLLVEYQAEMAKIPHIGEKK